MPFVVRSLFRPAVFAASVTDGEPALLQAETRHEAEAERLIALLERADVADLPPKMRAIADVVGMPAFLKLLKFGPRSYCGVAGREGLRLWIYVPVVVTPDHRLSSLLGMADFRRLVEHFGGRTLQMANCSAALAALRNRRIYDSLIRGEAIDAVALEAGISARQVRNIARDVMTPRSVQPIARVLGTKKTMYLIGQLPRLTAGVEGRKGQRVMLYVPKVLPPDHRLVRILGLVDAARLVEAFGGETLYPAVCNDYQRRARNMQILQLAGAGFSGAALAEKFGLTTRSVRSILKEIPDASVRSSNDN